MAATGTQPTYQISPVTTAHGSGDGSYLHRGEGIAKVNQNGQAYVQVRVRADLDYIWSSIAHIVQGKSPMRLKGYLHLFDPHTVFKWGFPNFYSKLNGYLR
jgi:hypothetical protein